MSDTMQEINIPGGPGCDEIDPRLLPYKDARQRMNTVSYVTDNVKEAFDLEGIEIPYPKRDIFITQRST